MLLRKINQAKKESYCIMFFPQQDKHIIFKINDDIKDEMDLHIVKRQHYSLNNGESFLSTIVEATSLNQAFSIGTYKLEDIYEKTLCGGSEAHQEST